MTTIENIGTIETATETAGQSVTATVCENAALYGATPERDEFDSLTHPGCPERDHPDSVQRAISSIVATR